MADETENLPVPKAKDIHYDIALDEDEPVEGTLVVLVDQPVVLPDIELRPVIPHHLKSLESIRATARRHAMRHLHRTAYHGIRAPQYALMTAWWSAIGIFRLAGRQLHWWWLMEAHHLRHEAAKKNDPDTWLHPHKEARKTRQTRGIVLALEPGRDHRGAHRLTLLGRWWAWLLTAGAAAPLLVKHRLRRQADLPRSSGDPRYRKLSADSCCGVLPGQARSSGQAEPADHLRVADVA